MPKDKKKFVWRIRKNKGERRKEKKSKKKCLTIGGRYGILTA